MDFQPTPVASSEAHSPAASLGAPLTGNLKKCTGCRACLPRTEFNWKSQAKGKLQPKCKTCTRAYSKQHHADDPKYYSKKAARNKPNSVARNQAHVEKALLGQSCRMCDDTKDLTHYQGKGATTQPVHQTISMGLGLEAVQAAMDRSQVICRSCLGAHFGESLEPWQRLSHAERQTARAQRSAEGAPPRPKDYFKRYKRVAAS